MLEVLQSYSDPQNFKIWGMLLRRNNPGTADPLLYSYYEGFYDLFNINSEEKCIEYTVEQKGSGSEIVDRENIKLRAKITEEELTESEYCKIQGIALSHQKASGELEEFTHNVNKMEVEIMINDKAVSSGYVFEGQRRIEGGSQMSLAKPEHNVVYISPSRHTGAEIYLTDILKYPELYEEMLEILRDYDKNIISINYDNDKRYSGRGIYKILSKSYKEALPLNVYGDGMKKAILLMSAVLKAQNGILLLDEFETAIHTSAMDRTFRWILENCLKLNVQVFLTSHSREAIDKVLKCSENVRKQTALYTLYKEEDRISVRRLTGDKALEVQDEMGLELR